MFCITPTNKIILTKGDNAEIAVRVFNKDGSEVKILPSDVITLTVKKDSAVAASITKTADLNSIFLVPSDTSSLAVGYYSYQIDFERDNEVQTIIPKNIFELKEELR